MLTLLKRFEIWLLFVLIGGAIWWALKADPNPVSSGYKNPEKGQGNTPLVNNGSRSIDSDNQALLELKDVKFHPEVESKGGIVEVTLLGHSGTKDVVALSENNVEMLTTDGEMIRRFFVPFDRDPELLPIERSMVTLKYWINQPTDTLWLTYRDQTVKIMLPSA